MTKKKGKYDAAAVYDLLTQIVEEQGEETTAVCYYTNTGAMAAGYIPDNPDAPVAPMCIVGHLAYKIGGLDGLLSLEEDSNAAAYSNSLALKRLGLTESGVLIAQKAQNTQDDGGTWGDALEDAGSLV